MHRFLSVSVSSLDMTEKGAGLPDRLPIIQENSMSANEKGIVLWQVGLIANVKLHFLFYRLYTSLAQEYLLLYSDKKECNLGNGDISQEK